jgi:hypothetical protein
MVAPQSSGVIADAASTTGPVYETGRKWWSRRPVGEILAQRMVLNLNIDAAQVA